MATDDPSPVKTAPERNVPPQASPAIEDRQRVIDARALRKSFGGPPVLENLSLQVHRGEIYGLIGPSGSGKTTTIHLFCGHLRPSGGTVTVFGETPTQLTQEARRRIGYMPQTFLLYADLTVKQNVAFALGLYGLAEWQQAQRIRATLELVELWEARNRTARSISGGMQRRVALAAALVHQPLLLFADEPTANLDPILRAKLWTHFRDLSQRGRTLLITTQYIDEAEHCDRVGLMFDGALIAEGQPDTLRRQAFGGDVVDVAVDQPAAVFINVVAREAGVQATTLVGTDTLQVTVADATHAIPQLLEVLRAAGAGVRSIAQHRPPFDAVFIRLIEQYGAARPPAGRLQTSGADERGMHTTW